MNLKIMTDQFREFQLKRRQSHINEKMNTFTNVETQVGDHNQFFFATVVVTQGVCITICPNNPNYLEGRVILYGEHVDTYDDRLDSVQLNLSEGRGDDPLFLFTTPEEKRRFVIAVRNFLNSSNPGPEGNNEQNQDQQNHGSDSGRASASSGNSGEI